MGEGLARTGRRRAAAIAVALLLGLGLAISPAGAGAAAAADPLRVSADAAYTLDPGAGRVHVAVQYQVTDLKPNSAQFIYFYTGYRFGIQREARSIRATDSAGALSIETTSHEHYIEVAVDFRRSIYYRDTARFTVRYDLVGGAPRSSSSIRIGKAFATWGVWAWGDPSRGSVVVNLPQGFGSSIAGDPMSKASSGGSETLRATPADPQKFFAILSAESPLAYTEDRLSLDGGVEIVIHAWPEDRKWDDIVLTTLRTAMPELRELIGLDWPVAHDLNVRERYTPALEGYAGVFFTDAERIDVSEDLDPVVIVHEASHAWFNGGLFVERWIYEGLAQEYAWRVQQAVGGEDGGPPTEPNLKDPGFVLLGRWTFPEVIRDQKTDDEERYGYQASFWLMHNLVADAGIDVMRRAFAAADAHTTAYPGAGTPEKVTPTNNWKRLLDLVEPIDAPESASVESLLRRLALASSSGRDLDERAEARRLYRELVTAGDGWLPGWFVRRPMGEWSFDVAERRMTEANSILDLRGRVVEAAAALGLTPDAALRSAYEGADDGLDAAMALATDELAALAAIDDARAKVDEEPDFVAKLGLWGAAPQAQYDAARSAFAQGDIAGAKASAAAATALMTGAASIGQQRLLIGVAVAVLVLLVALLLARRRRRRRVPTTTVAVAADPYATLAAHPDAAPPIPSEPQPDAEGGGAGPN